MQIIGFGHRSKVGKSSAQRFLANYLRLNHPHLRIQQGSLFQKPKTVAYELYAWSGLERGEYYEQPENYVKKTQTLPLLGKTPTDIWIALATTLRSIHPDTIIESLFHSAKCDVMIISDVRDPREIDKIHSLGGLVYKVTRISAPRLDSPIDDLLDGYDKWNGTLTNDGTLPEFRDQIIKQLGPLTL